MVRLRGAYHASSPARGQTDRSRNAEPLHLAVLIDLERCRPRLGKGMSRRLGCTYDGCRKLVVLVLYRLAPTVEAHPEIKGFTLPVCAGLGFLHEEVVPQNERFIALMKPVLNPTPIAPTDVHVFWYSRGVDSQFRHASPSVSQFSTPTLRGAQVAGSIGPGAAASSA